MHGVRKEDHIDDSVSNRHHEGSVFASTSCGESTHAKWDRDDKGKGCYGDLTKCFLGEAILDQVDWTNGFHDAQSYALDEENDAKCAQVLVVVETSDKRDLLPEGVVLVLYFWVDFVSRYNQKHNDSDAHYAQNLMMILIVHTIR